MFGVTEGVERDSCRFLGRSLSRELPGIYDLHNALIEASCCEAVVANSLPGTPASS
jgi:hypothetical protein